MPAPSPVFASAPEAPRWSRLHRAREAELDDRWLAPALHVDDEPDAARVVLELRVVQALGRGEVVAHGRHPGSRWSGRGRDDAGPAGARQDSAERGGVRDRKSPFAAPSQEVRCRAPSGSTRNELDQLLGLLEHQRAGLRNAALGLTDDQARLTPTVSRLGIGGLLVHVSGTEASWIARAEAAAVAPDGGPGAVDDTFAFGPGDALAAVLARYDEVAAHTEDVVRRIGDLDHPVPVPKDAYWAPRRLDAWNLRWVLLHLVQETARHAGHADIIREAIDGATMYELHGGRGGLAPEPLAHAVATPGAGLTRPRPVRYCSKGRKTGIRQAPPGRSTTSARTGCPMRTSAGATPTTRAESRSPGCSSSSTSATTYGSSPA